MSQKSIFHGNISHSRTSKKLLWESVSDNHKSGPEMPHPLSVLYYYSLRSRGFDHPETVGDNDTDEKGLVKEPSSMLNYYQQKTWCICKCISRVNLAAM